MRYKLKIAKPEDADLVYKLVIDLFVELGDEASILDNLNSELIKEILLSKKTISILVANNEDVVGLMTLTESQAIYAGGIYGVIDEMYVVPSCRSKGVGAVLINHALEIAKERRWNRLDVTAPTDVKWEKIITFYKKNNFVFTGPKFTIQL